MRMEFVNRFSIAFSALIPLRRLILQNVTMARITFGFLQPIRRTIEFVTLISLPDENNLNDVFGQHRLSQLYHLNVWGEQFSNATRTLTSANFTYLPAIRTLHIIRFGIEHIQSDAFDVISENLQLLNLCANKLKTIETAWFANFMDRPAQEPHYLKTLQYNNNPLRCDCNFYELQHLAVYFEEFYKKHSTRAICTGPNVTDIERCENLQTISTQKLNSNPSIMKRYTYPKLYLRMADHSLAVKTTFKPKYRLLVLNYERMEVRKRTKCPSVEWMRTMVQCLMLRRNGQMDNRSGHGSSIDAEWEILSIARSYFQHSPIAMVFAILTVPKKNVWPLHIQTIRNTIFGVEAIDSVADTQWHTNANEFDIDINAYLIFITVIICGLAAGFLCGQCKLMCCYLCYFCRHRRNSCCRASSSKCKLCWEHMQVGQEVLNR